MALARMHDERVLSRITTRVPEALLRTNQVVTFKNADVYALGRALTAYGPGALPALGKLLQHPKPEVVSWAIRQHGTFRRNDAALNAISPYLNHPDLRFRRAAAAAFSQLYHPRAEALIIPHLADSDPEVRAELASALANYGTVKALPALQTQSAKEKDPDVKRPFVLAIASIQAQAAVPSSAGSPAAKRQTTAKH